MARIMNLNIDDKIMDEFDELCEKMGMNAETAFGIFIRKSLRAHGIPFDVTIDSGDENDDPFYSPENMARLKKSISQLESGNGVVHEVKYDD